jgi:hypothetical protein
MNQEYEDYEEYEEQDQESDEQNLRPYGKDRNNIVQVKK